MIVTSIEQCAREVCGRIIYPDIAGHNDHAYNVSKVVMDSRKVRPGSLFIAIRGERSDGHDFVRQIGADGAVAAVVEHAVENADIPQIVVSNTVKALGSLARYNIARRRELAAQGGTPFTVIGITGSVGKTTTKDIAYSLLFSAGPTVAPQGSFNNEIGLPYTALEVDRDTRFLIA
ncbi:MAG: UDP-N-acetylmuramoyl-tripeptide--D-alanyl-D-alanine ligase, partial [Scardovia wiggsiae]|nr:UDP-N-acetylmuramoyl-tripeptide--D-alanyl-D-alanine ligase [Scardovia wiggsiae]